MTAPVRQRRTYRGEEEWFPVLDKYGHRALRAAFIEVGASPTVAGQLVWFLDEQMHLERHQAADARTKYRGILRELDVDIVAGLASSHLPR